MTPALALLFIGLLLIALGLRSREESALRVATVGVLLFCISLALFTSPARAAEAPADAQRYAIIKLDILQQAAALIQAQSEEIARLRDALKTASTPKECI